MSDPNLPLSVPPSSPPLQAGMPGTGTQLSKCALWSLITGILSIIGLFLLTALPAIILGIVGLVKIGKPEERLHGKGFAIWGLVLGCLSILVFPILLAMAVPAYNGIRQSGMETINIGNMKQISLSCQMYASDNEGKYPEKLDDLVSDYLDVPEILQYLDPADIGNLLPYQYIGGLKESDDPNKIFLAAPIPRRNKRSVAYLSGMVSMIQEEEYQELIK